MGWDLDFTPLEAGRFHSEITQTFLPQSSIGSGKFYGKVLQTGSTLKDYRTFVIPMADDVEYLWRKHSIKGNTLSLFPPSGELHSVSNQHFKVYTMSFTEALMEKVLGEANSSSIEKEIRGENSWSLKKPDVLLIRHLCAKALRSAKMKAGFQFLDEEILRAIFRAILAALGNQPVQSSRYSYCPIGSDLGKWIMNKDKAQAYLTEYYADASISERTIQSHFKNQYGISPKKFMTL